MTTDLVKALEALVESVRQLRNWPELERMKKLRGSDEFAALVLTWEDAHDALAAHRAQEQADSYPR